MDSSHGRFSDAPEVHNIEALERVPTGPPPSKWPIYGEPIPTKQDRRICGLRPATFWLSLALAAVIIIAAAVGGGVGGTRHTSQSSSLPSPLTSSLPSPGASTTSAPVPSSTATTNLTAPTQGLAALDCPNINGRTYTKVAGGNEYSFQISCGVDYPGRGSWVDIIPIAAYSVYSCMDACAGYNTYYGSRNCIGIEFNANLASISGPNLGNCWLKNNTNYAVAGGNTIAGAKLLSTP
ncbi:MAG: hypothetical protein M1824_001656 [Vezdaea acicularis]|nr:MAG: hypothetical protein M1824_001656 [Vezdaea acicularis]